MNDAIRLRPRPTTYNGVQMRSRLEAGFAMWLDSMDARWTYEPQAFASPEGQYLPDFRIDGVALLGFPEVDHVYVEVKPKLPTRPDLRALQQRMGIIHASDGSPLVLAYKDPVPGFLVSLPNAAWLMKAAWVVPGPASPHALMLAVHLDEVADGPWTDGYWRGPEA